MIDMNKMLTLIADAVLQSMGGPDKETVMNVRKVVRSNFPDYHTRIGFCLALIDEALQESDGKLTREDVCDGWINANKEGAE